MGNEVMFFEMDRIAREERIMPTESTACLKCGKRVRFTAEEDRVVIIECKHCGHQFEVVIESMPKKVA